MAHNSLRFALALAATSFVAPVATYAQPFEGMLTMSVNSQRGTQHVDYFASRNGKARINVDGGQGSIAIIMSPAEKKVFMLVESQAMYIEQDISQMLSQEDRCLAKGHGGAHRKEGHGCRHGVRNRRGR